MTNRKYNIWIYKAFALMLSLGLVLSSCDNVLDEVDDLSNYPGQGTFDDVQTVNAYLSALYGSAFGGWPLNEGNRADESGGIIAPDWITENNGTMKFWPYDIVRRVNIMLQELPEGGIPAEDQGELIAQAKFIRAYLYFKMVYYHGGVPIITVPQQLIDDLEVTRNSTAECFDFIIKDLDEAISNLPVKYSGDDFGRIDQATARSFKGKVLLYKASPQFNPSNPYDNSHWQDAYQANLSAKEFLDANGYGLLDNYTDVFETSDHKENIFSVVYVDPIKTNGRREDAVRPLSESKNATGGDQPIWALAESFPMKDGKMPGDPSSAYTYDVQNFWENRDPRFEATIVWNGAHYPLSGKTDRRQYTMTNIALSVDAFGYIIQGESSYRTGLYCRKGIMEELPPELVNINDVDWPEMRYAEILFNFAEAANETGHPNEAIQVLKDIRARAGIEAGNDGMYGLSPAMSREEIREAILHEKYIEMAFEGQRFWDLRRHRMLDRLDGMHKYGVMALEVNGRTYDQVTPEDVAAANNNTLLPGDFNYEVVELITTGPKEMSMPEKYYFFPIQLNHLDRNPNLEQNQGWEGGTFDPTL
ncbi:RagB/SusD family nutrient uptake outer membrane protein [Echinicola shivajiensis]|uniref:RagB/SusD family nutrient uptake outer membrane protein n=1 Tax=Echinicola shivajiensis TaxID=1035916 RepID=UPI001BFC9C26|nr:RagB/SusD family nutrient uptake outer membrane protein [Echinicola shivajiensis]